MIEIDDTAIRAITNARALLDVMQAGGWAEVRVTSEDGDYYFARNPGTSNPLVAPAATAVAAGVAPVAAGTVQVTSVAVSAPHVGTVAWLAAVGQAVAEGEAVARLAVLDRTVEVPATRAGTVTVQLARLDDLAEFATPLVELAA